MPDKKKPFPWFYPLTITLLLTLMLVYFFILLFIVHSFLPQLVSYSTFLIWIGSGFLSALGIYFTYKGLFKQLKRRPSWQKALGIRIPD
jgi:positive regulator of sigma E activity